MHAKATSQNALMMGIIMIFDICLRVEARQSKEESFTGGFLREKKRRISAAWCTDSQD
jgi:hypothetical protein